MCIMGSMVPFNHEFFRIPIPGLGSTTTHLITNAAALRLGSFLRHRLRLQFVLPSSSFKYRSHLDHLLPLQHVWREKAFQLTGFDVLRLSYDTISFKFMSWYFINQNEDKSNSDSVRKGPQRALSNRRKWTNILIAINIVVYMAQFATQGKLLTWGAKINSLIDKGEFWRLITSSFLHANIGHLMVNCYSLDSIGPTVENIIGSKRFLSVYTTSAVACSAMSYFMCKTSSVGASGAIFGLVGSFGVFVLRHKDMSRGSDQYLQHIMRVITLNMAIGILFKGIDNWGHAGGLLGGAAASWLLGPAWKLESIWPGGHKALVDRAPIFTIMKIVKSLQKNR